MDDGISKAILPNRLFPLAAGMSLYCRMFAAAFRLKLSVGCRPGRRLCTCLRLVEPPGYWRDPAADVLLTLSLVSFGHGLDAYRCLMSSVPGLEVLIAQLPAKDLVTLPDTR